MINVGKQKIQNSGQTKDKCTSICDKESFSSADKIDIKWELLNNDIEVKNGFEAKFTIENKSEIMLTKSNWKLFFNVTPRSILDNESTQPAFIHHISGDWFHMTPEKGFLLKPGDSVDITYRGMGALIKESD